MNTLFGISMDTIMAVSLGIFLALTALVAALALRNRLLFKLALRNIPRRRAQTVLIVVGLMLSTVIITSAFGTGDTVSYSIRSLAVSTLGGVDETVTSNAAASAFGNAPAQGAASYLPAGTVERLRGGLGNADVDGVTGAIVQGVPMRDLTTRQTKASAVLMGAPADYPAAFGALTTTGGDTVTLGALGTGEVYLNDRAAQALGAHAGDRLAVYVLNRPVALTVRAILRNEGLATGGLLSGGQSLAPQILLGLDRVQALLGRQGQVGAVLISNTGDNIGGAVRSGVVADRLAILLANPGQVGQARAVLAGPQGQAALLALEKDPAVARDAALLKKLRDLAATARGSGATDHLIVLLNDKGVQGALRTIKQPAVGAPLNTALVALSDDKVSTLKQDGLDAADIVGSVFSTIFVVFGLFSIAAGIMLIFLIFVMLAAERRAEMGMARAIGTKRRHLIQQFLFEGYTYDLGAALVGIAVGAVVGMGMVTVMATLFGAGGFDLQRHIEPRSVVVAFCLGAIVTFCTVAFSAWRVSRLNVVAAIRDLPDDHQVDRSIGAAFRRPLTDLGNAGRLARRGRVFGALRALLAAPLHLVLAFGVFISRGPLLVIVGYALFGWGIAAKQQSLFGLGISLMLVGAAMLLRWILGGLRVPDRVRNRLGYSLAGVALVVFWLLPFDTLRSDLSGGIEMFFLSGMMLVLGGVWTIMYNSDLLLGALLLAFGGLSSLAPALKMAATYPLQNRVRTGLTLSMFSLVIFTLMIMSVLTVTFSGRGLDLNRDRGGYQLAGTTSPANPITDIAARVAAAPNLRARVAAAGSVGALGVGLRQPGQPDQSWRGYRLNVADDAYLTTTRFTLHQRARGYGSDAQVWRTLRTGSGYAVVGGDMVKSAGNGRGGGNFGFQLSGLTYDQATFTPVRIEVRDVRSGRVVPLTVIGVLDRQAATTDSTFGVYTGRSTLAAAGAPPVAPTTLFFRVAPGQDVHATALALGSAFLPNGLDLVDYKSEYATNQALGTGLYTLLEGFMGLGLVVGIAALGVVATRSVVERRQQIGMMRAIGFKRRMVQISFLLESSFVSLAGTALGVALGLLLARNLVANLAKNNPGITLVIPWGQVILIVTIAYLASLLTTFLPAWQASRIYPAEALRYE